MNKSKVFLTTVLFILLSVFGYAQNNENNFNPEHVKTWESLLKDEKYSELFEYLQEWETKESSNPELLIAYANYYIYRNRFSGAHLVGKDYEVRGQSIQFSDIQTGEIAGYIVGSTHYDEEDIIKAVEYLDRGIKIAPNRLDIHFGKIHILNEIENYKDAGQALRAVLEISKKNNNEWFWINNEKMENTEHHFLHVIQPYYGAWLKADTKESLAQVKQCAEKQIELYPKHIYAYNNLAVSHYAQGQSQEALRYFLQAEKIEPNDSRVLFNLAHLYREMNDPQKAKEYLTKILAVGDEQEKEFARNVLDRLE